MQRIRPAPRSRAVRPARERVRDPGRGRGAVAAGTWLHPDSPRGPPDSEPPGSVGGCPQRGGPRTESGLSSAVQLRQASSPPSGQSVKYSSSSGPGLGGAQPSAAGLLFSGKTSPTSPPRRSPAHTPAPPHRAPREPPSPAGLAPVPGSSLGATEGSRGSGPGSGDQSPWEPPQPRSPNGKLRSVGRIPALR